MSYAGFLKELRKLRGKYELAGIDRIIRAKHHRTGYCPIIGVARLLGRPGEVTTELDLAPGVRSRIMRAADGFSHTSQTRRDLLRVLGLRETK